MTRKIYRSAQGKTVDLGALQLKNENVRAVGNQKVNARGDLIDSNNHPIVSRNQQVAKQYRRQTTNTKDSPIPSSAADIKIPTPPEDFEDDFVRPPEPEVKPAAKPVTRPATTASKPSTAPEAPGQGLAAAIARARQIKQEPIKNPVAPESKSSGLKKI